MIDLFETASQLQDFCDRQAWHSCFIGGIAVQRWGEPRVTRDVDLTLLAGFGAEDAFIDVRLCALRSASGECPRVRTTASRASAEHTRWRGHRRFAGRSCFEERLVSRATTFAFGPGLDIRTCSAEDLVVLKLFASRALDIRDAEGVVIRHNDQLDWGYIDGKLRPLVELKEEPAILDTLARLRGL
jgi:hypothetical protein